MGRVRAASPPALAVGIKAGMPENTSGSSQFGASVPISDGRSVTVAAPEFEPPEAGIGSAASEAWSRAGWQKLDRRHGVQRQDDRALSSVQLSKTQFK